MLSLLDYCEPNPRLVKTQMVVGRRVTVESLEGGHGNDHFSVGAGDCDSLVTTLEVASDRVRDVLEGATEKNVVSCLANDVDLQVERDTGELEGDVASKA